RVAGDARQRAGGHARRRAERGVAGAARPGRSRAAFRLTSVEAPDWTPRAARGRGYGSIFALRVRNGRSIVQYVTAEMATQTAASAAPTAAVGTLHPVRAAASRRRSTPKVRNSSGKWTM